GVSSLRASGTVIQYEDNEIRISLEVPMPDWSIYSVDVVFIFKEEPGNDPGFAVVNAFENMSPEDIGSASQFEITIHNCALAGGVANDKPLPLVDSPGAEIYLNFVAETRGRSVKKILYYSFYSA
ncbi:MAG TPA: hypothetical protein VHC46_02795, partial [Thermodesulfobacteriota bacterium]|nr:hypothetical protein [Thermodesulfobacteriota bacterium]